MRIRLNLTRPTKPPKLVLELLAAALWVAPNLVYAQSKAIDVNQSALKIRVFKSGAFSGFAHDHEIQAPIAEGRIEEGKTEEGKTGEAKNQSVQLRVDSRKLRVLDPELSSDKRAEIQQTMQSAKVLDVEKFPEIAYQSTGVTAMGNARWQVRGTLSLHGTNQPVVVEVWLQDGHYRGSASFRQTTFGITPITIAGGAIKVKDEIKIEFDIVPAK